MYADAQDGNATLTAGSFIVEDNVVSVEQSAVNGYYYDYYDYSYYGYELYNSIYGVYVNIDNMYADAQDGNATLTAGSFTVEDNVVSVEQSAVNGYYSYYYGSEYVRYSLIYGIYIDVADAYAGADGGEAAFTMGDICVSHNAVDISANESYNVELYGMHVSFDNLYAEGNYGNACATVGDLAVDCNTVSCSSEYVEYLDFYGIQAYVEDFYADAYYGDASFAAGVFTLNNNVITLDAQYAYDVNMDGLDFEIYSAYADVDGDGSATAEFGSICIDNNVISGQTRYMSYYDSDGSFDFEGIIVDVEDNYATVGSIDNMGEAVLTNGDFVVFNNTIEASCYEAYIANYDGINVHFDELYAAADGGDASHIMGVFDVSANQIDFYVDEGSLYVDGIYVYIEDAYADSGSANATVAVGNIILMANEMTIETVNTYYVGDGTGISLRLDDFYAEAYDYSSTLTVGDVLVCNNVLTADYVEDFYGIYVSLSEVYAYTDEGDACAVLGDVVVAENCIAISEYAEDAYGIYVYIYDLYAESYEGDASLAIGAIDVSCNEVAFAEAYDCYGIFVDFGEGSIYAITQYGDSAELTVENGFNIVGNTVTMSAAESCTGIYVEALYASASASFENGVAVLNLAMTVSENVISLEATDYYYESNGLNGISVEYYVSVYYDEASACVFGGLSVDGNIVTLTNDYEGTGIYVGENAYVSYDSNNGAGLFDVEVSVQDNTVTGGYYGIHIDDAMQATICGNIVTEAYDAAIYLEDVEDVIVTDNTCTESGRALYVSYAENMTISGMIFSNNENGVEMNYVTDLVFTDNIVTDNLYEGVDIYMGYNVTFTHNLVSNNGDGMDVDYVENLLFAHNDISYNTNGGLVIRYGDNVTFTNNCVTYNGDGAYFEDVYLLIVEDNVFSNNEMNGMYASDCGNGDEPVIIGNNTFENNWNDGLVVENCNYVTIYNSVFNDNGNFGLAVYGGYHNQWIVDAAAEVKNNDAQFMGSIYVYEGATLTLDYVSDFLIGGNGYDDGYDVMARGPSEELSRIEVMEGGCLVATSTNFYNYYGAPWLFLVNGNMEMIDCSVMYAMELYLGPASQVTIDTSSFTYAAGNGITIDGSSPQISGCTIQYSDKDGIVVMGADANPVIKGCLVHGNERGLYASNTNLQYVVDNIFLDNSVAGIYAQNVTGKIHDNVFLFNYREIFVMDSTVTVEDNQIGYAKVISGYSPYSSIVIQAVMDTFQVRSNTNNLEDLIYEYLGMYDLTEDAIHGLIDGHIGLYMVDSTVKAQGNDYGVLQYAVYSVGSSLTFSDVVETNYFTVSWYNANGTLNTFDLPFSVYDGIYADNSDVVLSGASIECLDDALFLEASTGEIADTTFAAGDFDLYLMEGSVVGVHGSTWEKYKVEDTSVMYIENLLTLMVKDQDGFGIAGATVNITDAAGKVWATGVSDGKGVLKVFMPSYAILADGLQNTSINPYTASATKDNATGSSNFVMDDKATSASVTVAMKKNGIFGMDPLVIGGIALVIAAVLIGALYFARKK